MPSGNEDKRMDEISVENALGSINRQLRERLKYVEEREKALEKAKEAFRQEISEYGCDNEPNDVLHLNVGGTHMAVLSRTLTSVEDSTLASKFSGRWDDKAEKDHDGNFFIDQPIELFKPMVDYLRARSCETPRGPPVQSPVIRVNDKNGWTEDPLMTKDFMRMVEYYGMTNGIYPVQAKLHCGKMGESSITSYPDFKVHSTEWATFRLVPRGHKRKVEAFEVTLGDVERAQIGWINPSKWLERIGSEQTLGVGDVDHTVALDCSLSGFRVNGNFTALDDVSIGEGSVIRCEGHGERWFVDGQPVQQSLITARNRNFIPAISGKGTWRISSIELEIP